MMFQGNINVSRQHLVLDVARILMPLQQLTKLRSDFGASLCNVAEQANDG